MSVKVDKRMILNSRDAWIDLQKELLEKERQAEVEQSANQIEGGAGIKHLEAKGVALCHLKIDEVSTGLFGRLVIILVTKQHLNQLPSHSFSSGDIVGIWKQSGNSQGQLASGVVSKVTSSSIHVALDNAESDVDLSDEDVYRLHKLANNVTYRRLKEGLNEVQKDLSSPASRLIQIIFDESQPSEPLPREAPQLLNKEGELEFFNKSLDSSQRAAVSRSLRQRELAVIHGPPGTGKTTALIEIILQHVKMGDKVLAVAPSNMAVDNMLERLCVGRASGRKKSQAVRLVRLGHPARATPLAQRATLDARVQASDDYSIINDIHGDIKKSLQALGKTRDKGQRARINAQIRDFRKELKFREGRISKDILSNAQVVLATMTSAGNNGPMKALPQSHFQVTVIDECSQGLECACYLSILRSPKVIIGGDHLQLPPTVVSEEAAKQGLELSLMERIVALYGDSVTAMLLTQYRMHAAIMQWPSQALYEGRLEAHTSVASHLLAQIPGVEAIPETEEPLMLIDTVGYDCFESCDSEESASKCNAGEAAIVAKHVTVLLEAGLAPAQIAVISPYNLQVELIRRLLRESAEDGASEVEVRSVDGFQGREKEAVIISLVRSNTIGEIGFLSEDRRLNVAVSRARRHVCVVCDSSTVGQHAFIQSLIDHLSENGTVKSAREFQEDLDISPMPTLYKKSNLDKTKEKIQTNNQNKTNKENQKIINEQKIIREKELKTKFELEIEAFCQDAEKTVLEFPNSLNSYERALVHEIAEHRGLLHQSAGEGVERVLCLTKREGEKEEREKEETLVREIKKFEELEIGEAEKEVENANNVDEVNKSENKFENKEETVDCEIENVGESDQSEEDLKQNDSEEEIILEQLKKENIEMNKNKKGKNTKEINKQKEKKNNTEIINKKKTVEKHEHRAIQDEVTQKRANKEKSKNEKENKFGDNGSTSKKTTKDNKSDDANVVESQNQPKCIPFPPLIPQTPPPLLLFKLTEEIQTSRSTDSQSEKKQSSGATPKTTKLCKICKKNILLRNVDMHSLWCERLLREKNIKVEMDKTKKDAKSRKKCATDSKMPEDGLEEDLGCVFPKCNERYVAMMQECKYCKHMLCLKHHQAEVHGCGEKARKQAKEEMNNYYVKNGVLTQGRVGGGTGSNRQSKPRSDLHRKLNERIDSKKDDRKKKEKKK